MFITDYDVEEVKKESAKLLKSWGIKQRIKKLDLKPVEKKETSGVFKIHLEKLCHKKAKLVQCDQLINIPAFLLEACNYLKDKIDTEGIFRRSGVAARQRELKQMILNDGRLAPECGYKATDVADLLKLFFRELPEPCIPYIFHDLLQKCFERPERHKEAIFLTLLLLPTTYLYTLAYLMQFLQEVAAHCRSNQMDASNLAIVWTPNLMPFKTGQVNDKQALGKRLAIIQLLIENSSDIGVVPECLYDNLSSWQPSGSLSSHDELEHSKNRHKKKKRRSGSLTRMLSGIKKMVKGKGSEEVEMTTPENPVAVPHTPRIISTGKKRKASESNLTSFSAKKRRDLLELLPDKALLPDVCTTTHLTPRVLLPQPMTTNCLGGEVEPKRRSRFYTSNNRCEEGRKSPRSFSTSRLRLSSFGFSRKHRKKNVKMDDSGLELSATPNSLDVTSLSDDYVRIPRSEFEDIKNRVSKIESRISSEFENIAGVSMSDLEDTTDMSASGSIKTVQSAYERTLESSGKFNSPTSDELAKRLSKELKIRGSSEKKVIRSPSARKIGTIRRRSRDKGPVIKRNLSLNIVDRVKSPHRFYSNGLSRGKPNTVSNGLPSALLISSDKLQENFRNFTTQLKLESYDCQRESFSGSFDPGNFDFTSFGVLTRSQTRRASSFHGCDSNKVSNADPSTFKVQNTNISVDSTIWKNAETFLNEESREERSVTGRPSLAKIRSQNAGMVLAKAKMFNTMIDPDSKITMRNHTKSREIKKRNSSKSSKERKLQRKKSENQNKEPNNSIPKQAYKSVSDIPTKLRGASVRNENDSTDYKENFPKNFIKYTQTSAPKTPTNASKMSNHQYGINKPRNQSHVVHTPLRERTMLNSPIGSGSRAGIKKGTPRNARQPPSEIRATLVKTVPCTPRRSPRQLLHKSKYSTKPL